MTALIIFIVAIILFAWLCCSATDNDEINVTKQDENYVIEIDDKTKKDILLSEIKKIEGEMNDEELIKYTIADDNNLILYYPKNWNEVDVLYPYIEKTQFEEEFEKSYVLVENRLKEPSNYFKVCLDIYKKFQENRKKFEDIYPIEKEKIINEYRAEIERLNIEISTLNIK